MPLQVILPGVGTLAPGERTEVAEALAVSLMAPEVRPAAFSPLLFVRAKPALVNETLVRKLYVLFEGAPVHVGLLAPLVVARESPIHLEYL